MKLLSVLSLMKLSNSNVFCIIFIVLFAIDLACYLFLRANKKLKVNKYIDLSHKLISILTYLSLIWAFFFASFTRNAYTFDWVYYYSGTLFSIYVSKCIYLIFRILINILSFCIKKQFQFSHIYLASISVFVFLTLVYGMLIGRFNWEIKRYKVDVDNLPTSFQKLKIVQLSDLHLGVFPGYENRLQEIIDSVNAQKPDLVFLTGDIINCFAEEIEPFTGMLSQIKAKKGKFAVLGNHDYGDYYRWKSPAEKLQNHKLLLDNIGSSGFELLNNKHKLLIANNDSLYIAGVENWGKRPYRQEGNIAKAISGIPTNASVLLLSHDPEYWNKAVVKHKQISITFSGHTHGMQIGFRIFGFEWSPFAIGKKQWKGWYKNGQQLLYINKGFGGALYPGRVGIKPELSVFTLQNGKLTQVDE